MIPQLWDSLPLLLLLLPLRLLLLMLLLLLLLLLLSLLVAAVAAVVLVAAACCCLLLLAAAAACCCWCRKGPKLAPKLHLQGSKIVPKWLQNGLLEPSWSILASWSPPGALLEGSWRPLGCSWGGPGGVLRAPGAVLEASWALLEQSWALLGASWKPKRSRNGGQEGPKWSGRGYANRKRDFFKNHCFFFNENQ